MALRRRHIAPQGGKGARRPVLLAHLPFPGSVVFTFSTACAEHESISDTSHLGDALAGTPQRSDVTEANCIDSLFPALQFIPMLRFAFVLARNIIEDFRNKRVFKADSVGMASILGRKFTFLVSA